MPHWDFARTEPVAVEVRIPAGSVSLTATPTDVITVDVRPTRPGRHADEYAEATRVEFTGDRLIVSDPDDPAWRNRDSGLDVVIIVPIGSRCEAETASAEISCLGDFESVNLATASGPVHATSLTGEARVASSSGAVTIADAGSAWVATSSGSVELGQVTGPVEVNSTSGRVKIGSAAGPLVVQNTSGSVAVDYLAGDDARIDTVSGDIKVAIRPGTGVYLDLSSLSGKVTSDLEPSGPEPDDSPALRLHCASVSGSVRVGRTQLS
jgi:hypothetical protein